MESRPKVILWDFDGVIIDSNRARENGFIEVLQDYPQEQVKQLIDYHRVNGGLSRYVKFTYFFEVIQGRSIPPAKLKELCTAFSEIMVNNLTDRSLLFKETNDFIKHNHKKMLMHIVSGSDQTELRYLCERLGIHDYFMSIHGSPTPKNDLVADLLTKNNYSHKDCLLIGDSVNDAEAAAFNRISFRCYNNADLAKLHITFHPSDYE